MAVGGTVATDGVGGIMSSRATSEFVSEEGCGAEEESVAELVLGEVSNVGADADEDASAVDATGGTAVAAGGVAATLTGAGAVAAGGAEGGSETGSARGYVGGAPV